MDLQALFKEGDILGSQYDGAEEHDTESWLVCRWKVVAAKIKTDDFEIMWNKQKSHNKSKFIPILQSNFLLRNLSVQRINFLWEWMERRKYKAGSLVCAQSKRSYINFDYNPYFVSKPK